MDAPTAAGSADGSSSADRSANQTPSANTSVAPALTMLRATSTAKRVLPMPPVPTSVSGRVRRGEAHSDARSDSTASVRPTKLVRGSGKLWRTDTAASAAGAVRSAARTNASRSVPQRPRASASRPTVARADRRPRSRPAIASTLRSAHSARAACDNAASRRSRRSNSPNDVRAGIRSTYRQLSQLSDSHRRCSVC
jgi:hypothetical protein